MLSQRKNIPPSPLAMYILKEFGEADFSSEVGIAQYIA
jgi:hypothetical protein